MYGTGVSFRPLLLPTMTLRPYRFSALRPLELLAPAVFGAAILATGAHAQNQPSTPAISAPGTAPASPYGGMVVEQAVARVNDQIITTSDYDRALKEMDSEARQRGATLQQISEGHKDLLRNLIDQQLWLSKGKELGINGETELVKQLDEIRKKYNLETLEDLEKAAREQGVSYEDFKANIRNGIITQQVMRDQVGRRVTLTPGEVQRYFEAHKQDYTKPESIHLSEILVATGTDPDEQKLATAKAKVDDIEAKLKSGADFDKLARSSSDGQTAAQGGEMGTYHHGELNTIFEDKTFGLKTGEFTEPIRTKQGYVILKVDEHISGGVPQFKDVQNQVEENFYMSRMEPAMRTYLNQMREEAYIAIRPGYTDTAATPNEIHPTITNSAYTPPAPKKKKKVQRTRFRETEHGFRKKAQPAALPVSADTTPEKPATTPDAGSKSSKSKAAAATPATMKAGKKEKIRFGQAPRETLPNAAETKVEDAGALPKVAENEAAEPDNPLQPTAAPAVKKSRYSARMKLPKAAKPKGPQLDTFAPVPPDPTEVADRQTQAAPLGLGGDTTKKKKKKTATATTGEKTRMQDRPKAPSDTTPPELTPAAAVPGAPAPATAPKPATAPQTTTPTPEQPK